MGRRAKQEYVNNKDFLAAMIEYKASVQNAETKNKSRPIVPTYVGECIMKIATHLARKPNFVNYTFKEEMISDGIENCLQYIDNFNPEKSNNPFAYFTQIIYYAFIRRIQKEKKQKKIKEKLIAEGGYEDMAVNEGDDGHYRNQYSEFLQKHTTSDEAPIKRTRKRKGKLDQFLDEDSSTE